MKRLVAIALLLIAGCTAKQGDPATGPDSFAVSLAVEPGPGAPVQRVDLPAAALVALKRADHGDIRVFDARGKPLSIARLDADPVAIGSTRLAAIPFDRQEGAAPGAAVSVRVEQSGQAVSVDTAGGRNAAQARSVLFDTRQVKDPAVGLVLDARLPVQRPVTVTLEVGSDLKNWDVLAERVLFRPAEGAGPLGSGRVALDGERLAGRYLLVSWSGAADADVKSATVQTAPTPPPPRVAVPTSGLKLTDAHAAQFALPPGPGPAAMRLTMTGSDGVVPVSLLGRNVRETPWAPLSMAVLRQGESGALLESAGGLRQYRIEADSRSAGFSEAPLLEFQYDPVALLVAFNGVGPYRLAVGNGEAAPALLNAADITTQPGPYAAAHVSAGRELAAIDLPPGDGDTPFTGRNLLLWGSLLLGVVVLAVAAWWLMRANAANPATPAD